MLLQGFNSNRVTVQAYCKAIFQQYFFSHVCAVGTKEVNGAFMCIRIVPPSATDVFTDTLLCGCTDARPL